MPATDPPAVNNWTLELPANKNELSTIKALHSLIKSHRKHAHYQNHSVQTLWDGMTPKDFVRGGQLRARLRGILYTHPTLSLGAFFFARRTDLINPGGTDRYSKYCMTFGIEKNLDQHVVHGIQPADIPPIVSALNDACWTLVSGSYAGSDGVELLSTDLQMVGNVECPSGDPDMQAIWDYVYNQVPVSAGHHLIEYDSQIWPNADPNFYLDPRYTSNDAIYRWYLYPRSQI